MSAPVASLLPGPGPTPPPGDLTTTGSSDGAAAFSASLLQAGAQPPVDPRADADASIRDQARPGPDAQDQDPAALATTMAGTLMAVLAATVPISQAMPAAEAPVSTIEPAVATPSTVSAVVGALVDPSDPAPRTAAPRTGTTSDLTVTAAHSGAAVSTAATPSGTSASPVGTAVVTSPADPAAAATPGASASPTGTEPTPAKRPPGPGRIMAADSPSAPAQPLPPSAPTATPGSPITSAMAVGASTGPAPTPAVGPAAPVEVAVESVVESVVTAAVAPAGRHATLDRSVPDTAAAPAPNTESAPFVLAPTNPVVSAAPTPAPAPVTASADPLPAEQLSAVLTPLRGGRDGEHQLTVHLHPLDLGPVTVLARLEHGAISVELTSGNDAARSALTSALPTLRQDLGDAGFSSVAVNVGVGSDSGAAPRQGQDAPSYRPAPVPEPATDPRPGNPAPSGLDRLL